MNGFLCIEIVFGIPLEFSVSILLNLTQSCSPRKMKIEWDYMGPQKVQRLELGKPREYHVYPTILRVGHKGGCIKKGLCHQQELLGCINTKHYWDVYDSMGFPTSGGFTPTIYDGQLMWKLTINHRIFDVFYVETNPVCFR